MTQTESENNQNKSWIASFIWFNNNNNNNDNNNNNTP